MEVYHASTVVVDSPNNQICIRSQQVLNECLTFKNSQRL